MRLSEKIVKILEKAGVPKSDIYTLEQQSDHALILAERCDPRAIRNLRSLTLFYRRIADKLDKAKKKGLISLEEWSEASGAVYRVMDSTESKVIEDLDICIRK